mgnify:CR=1 FL=1
MTHKHTHQYTVLGKQLMLRIMFATFVAVVLFLFISNVGQFLSWQSYVVEEAYKKQLFDTAVHDLQTYIDDNHMKSTDYPLILRWLQKMHGVGFVYGSAVEAEDMYTITFADKSIAVYPFMVVDRYNALVNFIATIFAFAGFVIILAPYIRKLTGDIAKLSTDMNILATGNLSHEISLSRHDELGTLAENINDMRLSVNQQIEKEVKSTHANQELITSLSHDLRTPLTKALGYLEIVQQSDDHNHKEKDYLGRIHKAILQVKERSDQLLKYSLSPSTNGVSHTDLDGLNFLSRIFAEMKQDLMMNGFRVEVSSCRTPFQLRLHPVDVERIFDNISSNIIKYADPTQPVLVRMTLDDERVIIEIENANKEETPIGDGTGIGLITTKKLALRNNGFFHYERRDQRFIAVVKFQANTIKVPAPKET